MSKEVISIKDIFSKEDGSRIGYWTNVDGKDVLVSTIKDPVVSLKVYEIDEEGNRVLVSG